MLIVNDSQTIASTATSGSTQAQIIEHQNMWDAQIVITDGAPSAKTFTYLSGNSCTCTGHGYLVGLKVALTTTGTLPAGLSPGNYYIIVVNSNTIQFATSQANALAGTAVALSDAGSGTHTATPAALAGTLVVQKSNDIPPNTQSWFTLTSPSTAASQNISATTLNYFDTAAGYPYVRFLLTVTAGQCSAVVKYTGKGVY